MSLFSDGLQLVNDFVSKQQTELSDQIASTNTRYARTAQAQLSASTSTRVTNGIMDDVGQNPIFQGGIDTVNQAITSVVQQLIVEAGKKISTFKLTKNGAPLLKTAHDVLDGYYQVVGLVSTATVEIIMEMARGNARLILQELKVKEQIVAELQTEIKALNNAVMGIMNASPFFDKYFRDLLLAYDLITVANRDLKGVVNILKTVKKYNQITVKRAIDNLTKARDLILPDRDADVSFIRTGQFIASDIQKKTSDVAKAAVSTIPSISFKIGRLLLKYTATTLIINGLILLFLNALNDFINTYKRNDNIDIATINHIKAATDQLDTLLNDMKVLLFPSAQTKNSYLYPMKVSTAATGWGIRLAATIEWLKVEPGLASRELDITGESVTRYNKAVADLKAITTFNHGLAQIKVKEAQEELTQFPIMMGRLLLLSNTIIAANTVNTDSVFGTGVPVRTDTTPAQVRAKFMQAHDYLEGVSIMDGRISDALLPFINTPFELLQGADKVVKQIGTVLKDLGFDRASDLFRKADIKGFYNMNIQTATYVGAAASGLAFLIKGLTDSGQAVTDQDAANLNELKVSLDRQSDVKQVEATRKGASTVESFTERKVAEFGAVQNIADSAKETLRKLDPAAVKSDPLDFLQGVLGKALGEKSQLPSGGYPVGIVPGLPDLSVGSKLPSGGNTGGIGGITGGGIIGGGIGGTG